MLTILSIAYPFAPVAPDAVGGAEQVLWQVDARLVREGHHSLVIAQGDSRVHGTLLPISPRNGAADESEREEGYREVRAATHRALAQTKIDLVHMHGIDFHRYEPPAGVPTLVTLHLPPSWYAPEAFARQPSRRYFHCVSRAQRESFPPGITLLPDVPNGVPTRRVRGVRKREIVVALGRICPEKGFHLALDAATRARRPLILGGRVFGYPAHERYFHDEIAPRLKDGHRFLGPLGPRRRRRLLAEARCVLIASTAPETSSLVAMEALAQGTPVVAFRIGALPEIVDDGRTGFLVDDVAGMAEAIEASAALDPAACIAAARARFSVSRMTTRYLDVYTALTRGARVRRMSGNAA